MYKDQLESDLKTIFNYPEVNFGQLAYGNEQDVLICLVRNVTVVIQDDHEYAIVDGIASSISPRGKLKSGHFEKCIRLADRELLKRFQFSSDESNINFGGDSTTQNSEFEKYSIAFSYFYEAQYNPMPRTIDLETHVHAIN